MRRSGLMRFFMITLMTVVSAAQGEDAKQVVDYIYGPRLKQVAATVDKADDVVLAREMLTAAKDNKKTPDLLAALCEASYELGFKYSEGYATAAEAMKLLADSVPEKRAGAREKLIAVLTKQSRALKAEERDAVDEALIVLLTTMGDENQAQNRYMEAVADYTRALAVGKQTKSLSSEALRVKLERALAHDRTTKQLALLKEKLLANANDSITAEAIVRLYVFELDDPSAALSFLDRVKDEKLKRLVPLAAGAVKDISEDNALKLGEWYREQSLVAQGSAKVSMLRRSILYFEHYIAIHTTADIQLAKANLLLKELKAEAAKAGPANVPTPGGSAETVVLDLGSGVKMHLKWIKPGSFGMGSPQRETGRGVIETPHRVTLSKGFYMGATEVTQAQWKAVMGNDPSGFKGDALPVETISWEDAVGFCKKLSQKEGKTYRLPTEAEWEYACRAGTTTAYHEGDTEGDLVAVGWYLGNSDKKTHAVGQKKSNAWGLYDMHGNVWEWCSDWFGNYPGGAAIDPTGPQIGTNRVLRGGCWFRSADRSRAASRAAAAPDYRSSNLGFRTVLEFSE